jgi:hypothetical protein
MQLHKLSEENRELKQKYQELEEKFKHMNGLLSEFAPKTACIISNRDKK